MRRLHVLLLRLRTLLFRGNVEDDLRDEMSFHLERQIAANVAAGMKADEARYAALREFGGVEQMKEDCRDARALGWLEDLAHDLRFSMRALARTPGFTLIAVLMLALGIGANTAMFSVIHAVLLRDLPYPEPDRLVSIYEANPSRGIPRFAVAPPNFLDWQAQSRSFEAMFAYNNGDAVLTGRGEPRRLKALTTTIDLFKALGVQPFLGRAFNREDGTAGHSHVAVLSHGLWRGSFSSDAAVIGQNIDLDGEPYTVIGVMPPGFHYPQEGADVWIPLVFSANIATQRGAHWLTVAGRLKPGVSMEGAKREIATIEQRLASQYPDKLKGWIAVAQPMREGMVENVRSALWILLGAVSLLVLIACANLANLLLTRATGRMREMAIRGALGARRWRMVRQLLAESLLLASLGAAAGLFLAYWALQLVVSLGPKNIPRLSDVTLDPAVLMFTALVAVVTAMVFGLLPAWKTSRPELIRSLRGVGSAAATHDSSRLRSALVVVELALSLMLVAGAGLLIRSFARLASTDPGLDASQVVTFDIILPEAGYKDGAAVARMQEQLLEGFRRLPGVTSASLTSFLPMSGDAFSSSFKVDGAPLDPTVDASAEIRAVSGEYFDTIRVPLLQGRVFTDADRPGAPRVLVISQAAARAFWPNQDPIGKYVRIAASGGYEKMEGSIVGIVSDVREAGLDNPPSRIIYAPILQSGWGQFSVLLRSAGSPSALAAAARRQVHAIDANLPIGELIPLEEVVASTLAPRRFYMLLLSLFAGVAVLLATIGIYGVISFSVSQRTHEIGVRVALGADRASVLWMVLSQGLRVAAIGVAAGITAALLLSRLLRGMLVGISSTDPLTFALVAAGLTLTALIACLVPALRATQVDPMVALRYE